MAKENTTQSGTGATTGTTPTAMHTSEFSSGGNAGIGGNTGIGADATDGAEGIGAMARNLAGQAQQKAGEQVRSTVDKGRSRAADTLQEVARTLMHTSEGDDNPAAPYMNRAGEQVQRVAEYLRNSDMRQMMTGAEQFARRQPALFLGSAFAIGVLAARFLKSTRPDGGPSGGLGYGMDDGRYDRERSLASFREPTGYMADGMDVDDTTNDSVSWPNTLGDTGTSPTDIGPSGRR